ncbi:SGNH/GDSL hydrolase family protein [Rhodococcus sp. NPDC058514]|uniref:SGNH/GDSL hydrolase family protein n=1 Tax=unclassified Rhodococcus (in: high G+C Gram-positive bacteria) TaxID=192944 RepID=UPI00365971F0
MTARRWCDAALLVLAVATLIGLVMIAGRPDSASLERMSPAQGQVRPSPPERTPPSALFIGDSYTLGSGRPEMSYPCMAAAALGWYCTLSAFPGTGYISGGPANRFVIDGYAGESESFAERIPWLALSHRPDIVVLDGGRNDRFPPTADVYSATVHTIGEARRAWPEAKIVFIRPRYLADPGGDLGFDDEFMRRLASDPVAAGVDFVDPLADASFPERGASSLLAEDGIHPNPRGTRQIAVALEAALADSAADSAR